MPAQHFVPSFANAMHASSRTQANALRALALSGEEGPQTEWRERAAAALLLGAEWAGEKWNKADLARVAGAQEGAVAKHYAAMAEKLRHIAPR